MSKINKAVLKLAQENPEFRTALVAELKTARKHETLKAAFHKGFKEGEGTPGGEDPQRDFAVAFRGASKELVKLKNLKDWFGPLGMPQGTTHRLEINLGDLAHYAGVYFGQREASDQNAYPEVWNRAADKQGSRPVFLNMNKLWKTLPKRGQLRNSIELKNGTILSIQASENHYSDPRKDNAPYYTEFEVFVNKGPQLPELRPFAEQMSGGNHAYVPVGVLNKILKNYGYSGIALRSRSKRADKWETKPKGWTDKSRKKFWESLTSAAPKHKVTECIKRMDKHMGGNAGAFCASLADRVTPGWRKEVSKDKKKKASLSQPLSLRRDYGASDDEWLDQDEVRKHCPPCADKMAANSIRKVKASTLRLAMQRR
jgi:hypothetical protein